MRYIPLSILLSLALTSNAYAIFCPKNFSSITYGESVDQVISQCGQPDEIRRYQSGGNVAQLWTYFVKPHGYEQTTVKMSVLLANNQIANIILDDENINNQSTVCEGALSAMNASSFQAVCNSQKEPTQQSLASTQICGLPIKIGDSAQALQAACGKPVLMQQVQQDTLKADAVEMTELVYKSAPPVLLVFENNRLTDRKFI